MSTGVSTDQKRLGVRVLTPEGTLFDDVASLVVAPSVDGEVGILPRHAPLIALLKYGETRITTLDDEKLIFATTEGYLSVYEDQVLVLAEQAELADDIDESRARAALERAEASLAEAEASGDEVAMVAAESARRRARNRLNIVDRG